MSMPGHACYAGRSGSARLQQQVQQHAWLPVCRGQLSCRQQRAHRPVQARTAQGTLNAMDQQQTSDGSVRVVSHERGAYTVQGSLRSQLSPDQVFGLLADYANLPKVFSNITETHVLTEHAPLQLLQVCRWEFLVFNGTFKTLLRVHEAPQDGKLVFSLIKSSFMKDFVGQWQLQALPSGGCHVQHTLKVEPILDTPALFSGYSKKIFVQQVTQILNDLEKELQRHLTRDRL